MKRFTVISMTVVLAGLIVFKSNVVVAGDYHQGTGLVCSDCHTMHYSVDGAAPPGGVGGPNDKLLLNVSTNALCLTCHDADGGGIAPDIAPDVMLLASGQHSSTRSAGKFGAAVGTASASAHNLGVLAAELAWGGTWSTSAATGMTCANCHDPHGTANYRNLKLRPGDMATDIPVTDVTQGALTSTAVQYGASNIKYGADANGNPDISNWCAGCHKNFGATVANQGSGAWGAPDGNLGGDELGDNAPEPWHRHPSTHVTMGEGNTNGHASSAWYIASASIPQVATIDGTLQNADDIPICQSCHKAHGSDNPNSLVYDDGTLGPIEDGTSMEQTCNICHKKN